MKFELALEGPYNLTRSSWLLGQLPSDGTDVWTPARETLPAEYRRLQIIDGVLVLFQRIPCEGVELPGLLVIGGGLGDNLGIGNLVRQQDPRRERDGRRFAGRSPALYWAADSVPGADAEFSWCQKGSSNSWI